MDTNLPSLRIKRQHLLDGLLIVRRMRNLGRQPAVWSYDGRQLVVEFGDYTFFVDAQGNWPGRATMKAADLRKLANWAPVGGDTVFLRLADGKLCFLRSEGEELSDSYPVKWDAQPRTTPSS
jgi:hypothetical protein